MSHQRKGGPNCFEQGSYNFSCEKRRSEEAKPMGPAVFHQRHHCLTRGKYVNVFFESTSKNILLFYSV